MLSEDLPAITTSGILQRSVQIFKLKLQPADQLTELVNHQSVDRSNHPFRVITGLWLPLSHLCWIRVLMLRSICSWSTCTDTADHGALRLMFQICWIVSAVSGSPPVIFVFPHHSHLFLLSLARSSNRNLN